MEEGIKDINDDNNELYDKGKEAECLDDTSPDHRCELPGNYPVFTMVMIIYYHVARIWRILVTPNLLYNIYNH